jgi:hypothetical protein
MNHSRAVARDLYRDDGLAHGIPLRIHNDPWKEIVGALRAQKDWSKAVSPVPNYHGGLGNRFSFIRVTIPECLPDRLEIMSYANEYAFLYDGTSRYHKFRGLTITYALKIKWRN